MTPEEAITHAEEEARKLRAEWEECSNYSDICDGKSDCRARLDGIGKGCRKCAEEYEQLAKWLKHYKQLLEKQPFVYRKIKEPTKRYDPYTDTFVSTYMQDGR